MHPGAGLGATHEATSGTYHIASTEPEQATSVFGSCVNDPSGRLRAHRLSAPSSRRGRGLTANCQGHSLGLPSAGPSLQLWNASVLTSLLEVSQRALYDSRWDVGDRVGRAKAESNSFIIEGDRFFYDEKLKAGAASGNVICYSDTNKLIIQGDQVRYWGKEGVIKVYDKPIMKNLLEKELGSTFYQP